MLQETDKVVEEKGLLQEHQDIILATIIQKHVSEMRLKDRECELKLEQQLSQH